MYEWLSPRKLLDDHVAHHFEDLEEAECQLYLAVLQGKVRARLNGQVLGPEWRKQLAKMKPAPTPFTLPPDLELSVEDAQREWDD